MQASSAWRWVYNPEQQQLSIELGDGLSHPCPYKTSRLAPLYAMNAAFTLEDAQAFQTIYDALHALDRWSPMLIMQAALNNAILQRFGRPQMPQSWHFQQAEDTVFDQFEAGVPVCLNSGFANAEFVLLAADDEFAECMLLDESMALSEIKEIRQFDVIKVLHNRMQEHPLMRSSQQLDIVPKQA
ncbi:cell division protein [Pseudidiomarina aestuarii]|uniref:Cell division protein n=1 Tax=Pseudidiomarina aestuarii TaxID=624146 RepID=A0A7Z7ETI1_9GAMM|nr:cell division protein ZapC domain-containing protein [Pseudidiomarina aestuarii]RUO41077.1 cell division protein [Pseudidiomarina aestuarii]